MKQNIINKNIIKLVRNTIKKYNLYIKDYKNKTLAEIREIEKQKNKYNKYNFENIYSITYNIVMDYINRELEKICLEKNEIKRDIINNFISYMYSTYMSYNRLFKFNNKKEHIYLTKKTFPIFHINKKY